MIFVFVSCLIFVCVLVCEMCIVLVIVVIEVCVLWCSFFRMV